MPVIMDILILFSRINNFYKIYTNDNISENNWKKGALVNLDVNMMNK